MWYPPPGLTVKFKSMSKAIRNISFLLRASAAGVAIISLIGCAKLNSDEPLINFNRSSQPSSSYTWDDFLKDTDNNGNETVELEEFNGYLIRQRGQAAEVADSFSDMDLDADGSIDELEFAERSPTQVATNDTKIESCDSFQIDGDRNDDASINLTEWLSMPRRNPNRPKRDQFDEFDLNGDGEVTGTEYGAVSRREN